jgi:hypothetical protein
MLGNAVIAFLLASPTLASGELTYYSYALDTCYIVTVPEKAWKASPSWDGDQENPPLSARKAINLANKLKDKLVKDSDDWVWKFDSADLRQGYQDRWYWLVSYEGHFEKGALDGVPPTLRLVVLMDGTVVQPRLQKTPMRSGR